MSSLTLDPEGIRQLYQKNLHQVHLANVLPRGVLLRKEVIQPLVPQRLPCYDFIPITTHTFDGVLLAVRLSGIGCRRLS